MTKTAVAGDDGPDRDQVLAKIHGLLRQLGTEPSPQVQILTELAALRDRLDVMGSRPESHHGCCCHWHYSWYPASTYPVTTTTAYPAVTTNTAVTSTLPVSMTTTCAANAGAASTFTYGVLS